MSVDDITVDLGPIALNDAKAVQVALAYCINSGYSNESEFYAALVAVKAQLNVRIAKAEKTQRADIALEDVL